MKKCIYKGTLKSVYVDKDKAEKVFALSYSKSDVLYEASFAYALVGRTFCGRYYFLLFRYGQSATGKQHLERHVFGVRYSAIYYRGGFIGLAGIDRDRGNQAYSAGYREVGAFYGGRLSARCLQHIGL